MAAILSRIQCIHCIFLLEALLYYVEHICSIYHEAQYSSMHVLLSPFYNDFTMRNKAAQSTGNSTVCSTICLGWPKNTPSARVTGPLWGESTGDRWIILTTDSNTGSVSMWWRHHGRDHDDGRDLAAQHAQRVGYTLAVTTLTYQLEFFRFIRSQKFREHSLGIQWKMADWFKILASLHDWYMYYSDKLAN